MYSHFIPALAIDLNENLLFFLVFGVFALIKFLASRKKGDEEAAPEPQNDAEQARRTREIQEEIRRRIAENRKQPQAPAPVAAAKPSSVAPQPAVLHQEQVVKPSRHRQDEADVAAAGRSSDLFHQLDAARRLEAETRSKAAHAIALYKDRRQSAPKVMVHHTEIENMLHNPSSIRNAVILSEILSGPVSERREGACPGLR